MRKLFDDDVLGTKNVRSKPEYTARKSTKSVMSFWLTLFPVLLIAAVLAFSFLKKDLLFKIADKIAPIWSGYVTKEDKDETKDETAGEAGEKTAEAALEVYAAANAGEHGDGTFVLNANHC